MVIQSWSRLISHSFINPCQSSTIQYQHHINAHYHQVSMVIIKYHLAIVITNESLITNYYQWLSSSMVMNQNPYKPSRMNPRAAWSTHPAPPRYPNPPIPSHSQIEVAQLFGWPMVILDWFTRDLPGIYLGFAKDLPGIYQEFTKEPPGIYQDLPRIYQGFTKDLLGIYQWFTRDLPMIYQGLTRDWPLEYSFSDLVAPPRGWPNNGPVCIFGSE